MEGTSQRDVGHVGRDRRPGRFLIVQLERATERLGGVTVVGEDVRIGLHVRELVSELDDLKCRARGERARFKAGVDPLAQFRETARGGRSSHEAPDDATGDDVRRGPAFGHDAVKLIAGAQLLA